MSKILNIGENYIEIGSRVVSFYLGEHDVSVHEQCDQWFTEELSKEDFSLFVDELIKWRNQLNNHSNERE